MKRHFLLGLFFSYLISFSFGQNLPQKREILYQDVWKEIINCKEKTYQLNNATVVFKEESYPLVDTLLKLNPVINCGIQIGDIFNPNLEFRFEATMFDQQDASIQLVGVTFNKTVQLINLPKVDYFYLQNCTFNGPFFIDLPEATTFLLVVGCKFNNTLHVNASKMGKTGAVVFESCKWNNHLDYPLNHSAIQGNSDIELFMSGDTILPAKTDSTWFSIWDSYRKITLVDCIFGEPLTLEDAHFSEQVIIKRNTFKQISLGGVVYPPASGVYIEWEQLKGKMCLLHTEISKEYFVERAFTPLDLLQLYLAESDSQLQDREKFQKLITSHYALLQIYKQNGDIESANGCFVQTKDFQTNRMRYQYRQEPTVSSFFIWKTNQFLRYFSDYGTNPAKSVIISFYVILLFGGFYFFFYSAWDRINASYFLNRYTALSKYLTSKTTLKEFYESSRDRQIKTFGQFKEELKAKKAELPKYIAFLGHLFYKLTSGKYHISSWLISKIDVQKGLWKDLNSGKKILIGMVLAITIFAFVIYVIIIKALSATMLSLNAFSTLGFGNIPVKGLSKYLTVIEGFMGWLLLSIFSVSLVAQIIF